MQECLQFVDEKNKAVVCNMLWMFLLTVTNLAMLVFAHLSIQHVFSYGCHYPPLFGNDFFGVVYIQYNFLYYCFSSLQIMTSWKFCVISSSPLVSNLFCFFRCLSIIEVAHYLCPYKYYNITCPLRALTSRIWLNRYGYRKRYTPRWPLRATNQ